MISKLTRRMLLALGATLLTLGLAEISLRQFAPTDARYCIWPAYLEQVSEPLPAAYPGVHGRSLFRANSQGLRADELEPGHDPVILAVGGNTTECLVLDQQETWPHLLQKGLQKGLQQRLQTFQAEPSSSPSGNQDEFHRSGAWVGNAGKSGHGTREHTFQVPVLIDSLDRVDVLLVLAGANDLGLRLKQDEDYDPDALLAHDAPERMLPRAFSDYPRDYAAHQPFYKRTELYARLRDLKNQLSARSGLGTEIGPRGNGVVRWRDNRAHASEVRPALPDLESGLREYRHNLTDIVHEAHTRHVAVVLITQPSLWRSDLDDAERALLWWGGVGAFQAPEARTAFYSIEALAEGCARYNQVLLEVARDTGAHALDLADVIPRSTEMFFDDMHFTEAGARRVADVVSTFLIQEVLDTP